MSISSVGAAAWARISDASAAAQVRTDQLREGAADKAKAGQQAKVEDRKVVDGRLDTYA